MKSLFLGLCLFSCSALAQVANDAPDKAPSKTPQELENIQLFIQPTPEGNLVIIREDDFIKVLKYMDKLEKIKLPKEVVCTKT